jgi:GNAT superfamily N-acetyltransferase
VLQVITAHVESFTERLAELRPLLPVHYAELALDQDKVPLDPQFDIYLQRDARGEVLFVVLRDAGELIGYFIGFIAPGLHYRTCLTCTMDIFYVHPNHRGAHGGQILFKAVESELMRRGVQRWFVGSKVHMDASWLFEHLGFGKVETYYSKWIGD